MSYATLSVSICLALVGIAFLFDGLRVYFEAVNTMGRLPGVLMGAGGFMLLVVVAILSFEAW